MHILIAPNAFKSSLSAQAVTSAIERGLLRSRLDASCLLHPIADGGDGTLETLLAQTQGRQLSVEVEDALGRPIHAALGIIHTGKTAIVEMAEASGLRRLRSQELAPERASTYGTGQLILAALDAGVSEIIVGLGGSATLDGGLGMAQALGIACLDAQGKPVARGVAGLTALRSIRTDKMDKRLASCKITVMCDVTQTLMEAATVFGPQKGASPEIIREIDRAFLRYGTILKETLHKDVMSLSGGGAAGGLGAGLYAFLNADMVNGTEYLLSQTGFEEALRQSDLLITAEGALDEQTQSGKGPHYVSQRAHEAGKPVIMLAGSVPENYNPEDYPFYDAVFAIGARPETLEEAMKSTATNLERMAYQIGNVLALHTLSSRMVNQI